MAVRWTITFKTLTDKIGLVKVYDSTYSGDPIVVEPAVNAFSTTRQMQDFFQPVVTDSGYLRVIDNGIIEQHIEDLHPLGALDRPVEFYLDNILKWRGYISPESFTMDWEPAPCVVEFPLVGVLNILDSVTIQDNGTGLQPIAAFIKECLDATGFTWSKIVMVNQMLALDDGTYYDVPELRLSLSRYDFIALNNVENEDEAGWTQMIGESYLSVLESICRYFCWNAIQEGDVLYLSTPRLDLGSYPHDITYAALSSLASDPLSSPSGITWHSDYRAEKALSSLNWDGVNHRKSIKNGAKKVVIDADVNFNEDYFPRIKSDGADMADWDKTFHYETAQVHTDYFRGFVGFRSPAKENGIFRLWKALYYTPAGQDPTVIGWEIQDWAAPSGNTFPVQCRADVVKAFTYSYPHGGTDPDPKHIFKEFIRLCVHEKKDSKYYTIGNTYPMVTLYSYGANLFNSDGCFCINAFVNNACQVSDPQNTNMVDYDGLTYNGSFKNNLRMSLKVGNKYYQGNGTWGNTLAVFDVPVISEQSLLSETGTGHIKDTNDGTYNDAEGFIIPLDQTLEGKMELNIYPWIPGSVTGSDWIKTIFISGLNISYFNNNSDYKKGLHLSALTGVDFKDNKSVSLKLMSSKDAKIGNALLLWKGTPIGSESLFDYYTPTPTGGQEYQPEYWLLDSLVKVYSKPSTWLELQTAFDAALLMWTVISDNGRDYMITCSETDYADEHTKLIIASYE